MINGISVRMHFVDSCSRWWYIDLSSIVARVRRFQMFCPSSVLPYCAAFLIFKSCLSILYFFFRCEFICIFATCFLIFSLSVSFSRIVHTEFTWLFICAAQPLYQYYILNMIVMCGIMGYALTKFTLKETINRWALLECVATCSLFVSISRFMSLMCSDENVLHLIRGALVNITCSRRQTASLSTRPKEKQ